MDDDFIDVFDMSQDSLKEVWDNERDIWDNYLGDNFKKITRRVKDLF
tara:strand:- start:705 stop:845 length:141 start_codon:yes stop_codon:yes gene_type:complete